MEDLDECLLIAKIEVSCWKDQLKQAVSQFQLLILYIQFNQFLYKAKCITFTIMFHVIFYLFLGVHRDYLDASTG